MVLHRHLWGSLPHDREESTLSTNPRAHCEQVQEPHPERGPVVAGCRTESFPSSAFRFPSTLYALLVLSSRVESLNRRFPAGEAILMRRDDIGDYPLYAVSFNHRAEAFYQADQGFATSPTVIGVREKGLARVSVLHSGTPERVVSKLVRLMNQYHEGSGDSFLDFLDESLSLESEWKAHARQNRITTYNPKYLQKQQEFVLALAAVCQQFGGASSLAS